MTWGKLGRRVALMPTQMAKHQGVVVPLGKDKVIFYFSFLLRPDTEDLGGKKPEKPYSPSSVFGKSLY